MKILERGVTAEQQRRVGVFRCPSCTSVVELSAYDLPRWSFSEERSVYICRCPVCAGSIPESAAVVFGAGSGAYDGLAVRVVNPSAESPGPAPSTSE